MKLEIPYHGRGNALYQSQCGAPLSYAALGEWVALNRRLLRKLRSPAVAFQFCPNDLGAVASYLACMEEGIPIGLGEPELRNRDNVISAFRPNALILPLQMPPPSGYRQVGALAGEGSILWHSDMEYLVAPHPDLTVLLPTSGSTGAPKYVRLSSANLASNAASIAQFLQLGPGETAVQSLPFYYAYGLSILNSHLISGGAVAIIQRNFMDPDYWRWVTDFGCTSFAGVPYMYEVLRRLDLAPTDIPTLRTITQAGGHLPVNLAQHFHARARRGGKSFVIMYGQTEATARIAYVPSDRLEGKFGAIGIPIPGGSLSLVPAGPDIDAQQLRYRGPNVMMGYAGAPADLARGDDLGGILDTGDLAEVDPDGFFRIVGRIARFAKLFGKRINLQELELLVGARFKQPVAMTEAGGRLRVFVEGADQAMEIEMQLIKELQVPNFAVKVSVVSGLPRTTAGKIDYKMLPL